MKIRVVIPVLNNMFLTAAALMSLRAELPEGSEIVIVDNGSDLETLANIRADIDQAGANMKFLVNPDRGAYSKSVNMGAAAPGDYDLLLVTNNDVIFAPGSIEQMSAGISGLHELVIPLSPRDIAAAGMSPPKIGRPMMLEHVYSNYDAVCAWWGGAAKHFGGFATIGHPYIAQGGYAFMVTRSLWESLGGFDESYRLFGSDYDFFDRAKGRTKMIQARGAYVEHLEHQTVSWLGRERDIQMCKARFQLAEKRENLREIVSVIVPTFNRTDALFEAIDSVIAQNFPHWKLYVIDDGSKDWDRIQDAARLRYRGHESRIWFFHLEHNRGPGAARNFGLDIASGKYVAFLDSDDRWNRDHLEIHYAAHEANPDLMMSYSKSNFAWRWFDSFTGRFRYRPEPHPEKQLHDQTYSRDRLELENFIKTSTVFVWGGLVRRDNEFSEPVRFPDPEDHRVAAEDWQFFKAIADRGPVQFVPKPTACTHWAKLGDEESHHSSRIIPWADFGDPCPSWLAREVSAAEISAAEITIVTATRERPEQCRRLIENLPEGIPIIFVADGLQTGRMITPFTQESDRIGLLVVDEPRGPSFARNRGVEAVRTPWAWFLDDDDIPVPGALEALDPAFLEAHDVVIGELIVSADSELRMAQGVYTSAMLVRPAVFQRSGGFDENLRWAEERELLSRLEAAGARVGRLKRPIAIKTAGSFKAMSLASQRPANDRIRNPR